MDIKVEVNVSFEKQRKHFEDWVKSQFGVEDCELEFSHNGYSDQTINGVWVGFCAGFMIGVNYGK